MPKAMSGFGPGVTGASRTGEPIDVALLGGIEFECRPDCGLCCYATPAIDRTEQTRLLRIAPESTFIFPDRDPSYLAARPEGGACQFLHQNRCRIHPARPSPCVIFPIVLHASDRFQASVVLSCPGVSLGGRAGARRAASLPLARGLDGELRRAEARCRSEEGREALASARRDGQRVERRLQKEGRWIPTPEVRASLRERLPLPDSSDFPVDDPPPLEAGAELLPLYFDGGEGPVAIAGHAGGWQLVELQETGGVRSWLGVWPPPTRMPPLEPAAEQALRDYLGYWLERDALFGFAHNAMVEEPSGEDVLARVARELRYIGATVVTRARIRASAQGRIAASLTEVDIDRGIRASDADLLDRAGWTVPL